MGKKEREEKKSFASGKKEVNRLKEEEKIKGSIEFDTSSQSSPDPDVSSKTSKIPPEASWTMTDKPGGIITRSRGETPPAIITKENTLRETRMPPSVIAHKQKLASMSDKEFAEKHGHKSEKQLRDMGARHGYGFDKATKTGSDHYVKRAASKQIDEKAPPGAKYERMVKHIKAGYAKDGLTAKEKGIAFATAWKAKNREKLKEKVEFDPSTETPRNMEEAMGSVKKASPLKRFKTKANTVVRRGLGKERDTQTVLVTNKGDPRAAAGGGVHRIPKSKYNPSKHNLASE
jgi:hypothetical protein